MFYKYINENTVEKAPKMLNIGGKDVFTNNEKIYNSQGYYKLLLSEHPKDDKLYKPVYILGENVIVKDWVETENSRTYQERVVNRIREVYSVDDELAILRQRDTKPEEFAEYNAFVEKIKAEERNAL